MDNDLSTCPVSGWQVGPISEHQLVMLRLSYLTHAGQQEAHLSPNFLLNVQQVQELIEGLQKQLQALQSGPPEGSGATKH